MSCNRPLLEPLISGFIAGFCKLPLLLVATVITLSFTGNVSADDQRPNIVWIFVEDMSGWMGCYGDHTVPTPSIDRIAADGVRFNRAYMTAGVCSPSRSAIVTGAMQTSLGIHNHRSSRQRVPGEIIRLPEGVKTVYQLMREAGYYVYSNPGKDDFNFVFDRADLYDKVTAEEMGYSGPLWRDRPQGRPFFAQVQLLGGKNNGKLPSTSVPRTKPTDPSKVEVPPYYPDVPAVRQGIAHHYDCIRQTDDEVGRVLAALAEDDLLGNTIVFFFSDHGMEYYRHKQWLYEGGIHVPLVIMGPGINPGATRNDLVSSIDITATTLALAGVPIPNWMEGVVFFSPSHQSRDYVISARDRCDYTIDRVRAVTTQKYKYIRNFLTDRPFMQPQYRDGWAHVEAARQLHEQRKLTPVQELWWSEKRLPEEFYDLENDPHEINNLAAKPEFEVELEKHRQILTDWISATNDQGQYPESVESLRGVLKQWSKEAVNPEFDKAR